MDYELLKNIFIELEIDEGSDEFNDIRVFFESTKRTPSRTEVEFLLKVLSKATENAKDQLKLRSAKCASDDFKELLGAFINRYKSESSNREHPLITDLAEYAATGKAKQALCGVEIAPADKIIFPTLYSGSSEMIAAGDIKITLSYGERLGGDQVGDICAIFSPTENQSNEEFFEKVSAVCKEFLKAHPKTAIRSVTERGLLDALSFMNEGYVIDTRLLPKPGEKADAIFGVKPPSVLLFPKREELLDLWQIAGIQGIIPTAPIASRTKLISIRSGETTLEYAKKYLEFFNRSEDVCFDSCAAPSLEGETETVFDSELQRSNYNATLTKIGGNEIYEALADATSDTSSGYVIAGVLGEEDSSVLPLIITVDSFRRNTAPNVIYSRFFVGKTTSLYVLKLSKKK